MGPYLGATLASGFYIMMKKAHYETVVPGQDADTMEPTPSGNVGRDPRTGNTNTAFAVDDVSGPGISDYSGPLVKGSMGADLRTGGTKRA